MVRPSANMMHQAWLVDLHCMTNVEYIKSSAYTERCQVTFSIINIECQNVRLLHVFLNGAIERMKFCFPRTDVRFHFGDQKIHHFQVLVADGANQRRGSPTKLNDSVNFEAQHFNHE